MGQQDHSVTSVHRNIALFFILHWAWRRFMQRWGEKTGHSFEVVFV
jgi:hypothetical protein